MTQNPDSLRKTPFMAGVFLISFSLLVFQIVQTRILSVIAWYYLAFFGISMAMLGMTVGAVWVYLKQEHIERRGLHSIVASHSLACAISIPASLVLQLILVTAPTLSLTTVLAWIVLTAAMAVPYVFGGIVISLALTRSPFPVGQVYGVDLLGAALGCVSVLLFLRVTDAPSVIIAAGAIAAASSMCFAASVRPPPSTPAWKRPGLWLLVLTAATLINSAIPALGIRPLLVKESVERNTLGVFEKWNSFSRVIASRPQTWPPYLWGPSPTMPKDLEVAQIGLNIDGSAGTIMFHYDGTAQSIDFLRYDLVNLAYMLAPPKKAAIIGVGGGRDLLSAHLFGADEITGVELNPIFVDLHENHPFYRDFSGLKKISNLRLYVDDARSWFASTRERFDLVQMSMIDTWAATGAGAFSLSENGLYTLEGWRAFLKTLNEGGVFTVSRWYSPDNTDETGRMISLAAAALLDMGVTDPSAHIIVARTGRIATLVLSPKPFTPNQLALLQEKIGQYGYDILMAPGHPADSALLNAIVESSSIEQIDAVADGAYLDLSVPTDNRPFFFNQLKLSRLSEVTADRIRSKAHGVIVGNLVATAVLGLILIISLVAVICTIVIPLRGAIRQSSRPFVTAGTVYFFLIGVGFMFGEIALLQYFSVYLGHPIYSLGVCLFSLILATGLGSFTSGLVNIGTRGGMVAWALLASGYLFFLQANAQDFFEATTDRELLVRIGLSVGLIVPVGVLLGFAFPAGMKLVKSIDSRPAPWFWGINGAAGVLASAAGVMISMNFGIDVTASAAGACYLLLLPAGMTLIRLSNATASSAPDSSLGGGFPPGQVLQADRGPQAQD